MNATTTNQINHRPLGFEAPYSAGPDERKPRRPQENQVVQLGVTTAWENAPEKVYCYWQLNGQPQAPLEMRPVGRAPRQISPFLAVSPLHESGSGEITEVPKESTSNEQLCWSADFGPFSYGDKIEYGFGSFLHTSEEYPFQFEVSGWRQLEVTEGATGGYFLTGPDNNQLARINITTNEAHTFKLSLTSLGDMSTVNSLVSPTGRVELTGNCLVLYDGAGNEVLRSAAPIFEGLLSAQGTLEEIRLNFSATPHDFYGLGERFDHLNQRGLNPDSRVYEEYKNQGSRTYFPIPFGLSPDGFGLYLDTSNYAAFNFPETGAASCEVELTSTKMDIYFFTGTPLQILEAYTLITGRPVLPPSWIYTPWVSGNEWNTQARVMEQVNRSEELGIPTGVVVIEAWSDETTFYTFNDAQFTPRPAEDSPHLADFTFPTDGHWPDPKGMLEELHRRGIKLLLWQIPILKSFEEVEQSMLERAAAGQKPQPHSLEQHRRDTAYALEHDFCVKNADGSPYRNPGIWFHDAYVLDVTNPAAREWWMSRRAYLIDELGIDGFKTDGGEHLWGRDLRFWDGRRGAELINAYPQLYSQMYYDRLNQTLGGTGVTFSRAGFTGSQKAPCHWAGDENSTFAAFRHSIVAGLSAGLSGIPFWGWDIGGFSGPIPTSELYLRAAAMAVFCPIMQYHSEYNAHRQPNQDRTPWNLAERNGTPWLVEAYARLAQLRLGLVDYLEEAGRQAVNTGEPIMRALVLDWPQDRECRNIEDEYMLGQEYLVAPVVEEGADSRNVYLPEGQWQDFWEGENAPLLEGNCWLTAYPAPLLEKPVLVFRRVG